MTHRLFPGFFMGLLVLTCLSIPVFGENGEAETKPRPTGSFSSNSGQTWTHTLPNGFEIIIVENHSVPLASGVIGIRAGSRTEILSNNGISHLLEHLLFDGTETLTREELDRAFSGEGGYFNAFTREDFVCFEMVMPADRFDRGLELQAEQLLRSTIPDPELEKERKVVCEEIAQDVNNGFSAAAGTVNEILFGPSGYGLPVLGNYDTVNRVSREEIFRFYRSRYTVNRMVAVIAGDVDPARVIRKLRELYGSETPGPEMVTAAVKPVFPCESNPVILRKPVRGDTLLMVLPALSLTDPGASALEIFVNLWAGGDRSPLTMALASGESPLARSAGAWVEDHNGFSLLKIMVTPILPEPHEDDTSLNTYLGAVETAVLTSLETFMQSEIAGADFHREIKSLKAAHVFAGEKSLHLCRDIAGQRALNGLDGYLNREEILNSVAIDDVMVQAGALFDGAVPVTVLVTADKDAVSEPASAPDTTILKETLSNGLTVIIAPDNSRPLAAAHLIVKNPVGFEPGLPRMVSELLDSGTETRSADKIAGFIREHGIKMQTVDIPWLPFDDYYNRPDFSYIRLESLSDDFIATLDLMADLAFHPVFPESEIPMISRMLTGQAKREKMKASVQAKLLLESKLAPGSVYSRPELPDPDRTGSISRDTIAAFHAAAYTPAGCILAVAGDVNPETLLPQIREIFGAATDESSPPPPPAPAAAGATEPGQVSGITTGEQAAIRMAIPMVMPTKNLPALEVAVRILSSELSGEIREPWAWPTASAQASHCGKPGRLCPYPWAHAMTIWTP